MVGDKMSSVKAMECDCVALLKERKVMATFPGDMNIGWGFGRELEPEQKTEEVYNGFMYVSVPLEEEGDTPDENSPYEPPFEEPHLTDPLLAVSELEVRVEKLESYLQADPAFLPYGQLAKRITDLEERLRSLTFVVNVVVDQLERVVHDEGRIDGHREMLSLLLAKTATLENRIDIVASWQMVHDAGEEEKD
jgi:hypothetical protein